MTGGTYSQVCGRAVGYNLGTTDALRSSFENIDGPYLDGMSITHGLPRQHIC